jgi:hypothetical protein
MNMNGTALSNKPCRSSKIAARVRNINMTLLVAALVFITAMASVMVTGIADGASENFARLYSIEAVEKFNSYIIRDLVLVQKVSRSKAVTGWFADEGNQEKRALAYDEMMDCAGLLQDANLYFAVHGSLNEYAINDGTSLAGFVPHARLDASIPDDEWYFECINSADDYTLNIDIDKASNTWSLWINHKVIEGTDIAGVFCSGLPFDNVIHNLFAEYETRNVKGYVIDKHGAIQLDNILSGLYSG